MIEAQRWRGAAAGVASRVAKRGSGEHGTGVVIRIEGACMQHVCGEKEPVLQQGAGGQQLAALLALLIGGDRQASKGTRCRSGFLSEGGCIQHGVYCREEEHCLKQGGTAGRASPASPPHFHTSTHVTLFPHLLVGSGAHQQVHPGPRKRRLEPLLLLPAVCRNLPPMQHGAAQQALRDALLDGVALVCAHGRDRGGRGASLAQPV